jgi:hypothetical protein
MPRQRKQVETVQEERRMERVRLASKARMRAFGRLRDEHVEEYAAFYEEEATKLGVMPVTAVRRQRREALLAQLAELDREDGRIARRGQRPGSNPKGRTRGR